jgi:hypothetical protein
MIRIFTAHSTQHKDHVAARDVIGHMIGATTSAAGTPPCGNDSPAKTQA